MHMDEELLVRQMPHSVEAEQAVLGSMLIDARCVPEVIERLRPEDFYLQQNRDIYETIYGMFNYSETIDPVTVLDHMRQNGVFEENTSRSYLLQLMEVTPTAANVAEYVAIVKDKALLRRIAETAADLTGMIQEGTGTAQEVLDAAEQRIYAIRQGRASQGLTPISAVVLDVLDRLEELSKLAASLLKDGKAHEGAASSLLNSLDELGDLAGRVTKNADTALDLLQSLDGTLNTYEPQAQQALSDAQALTDAATSGLRNSTAFLRSAESLLKDSGGDLDEGTRQALSGLTDALRRSTTGLSQTDTIRAAKATITSLIEDEWNSHTGGDNNLLLMDADAAPISLTSSKNASPNSIQFIMRTQEIKVPETASEDATSVDTASQGTVWSRIAAMFRDFWHMLTGVFRRG